MDLYKEVPESCSASGFRRRLPRPGGLGQEDREGEAAVRAARHEEVRPQGDVRVQPVQDQDSGREGSWSSGRVVTLLRG